MFWRRPDYGLNLTHSRTTKMNGGHKKYTGDMLVLYYYQILFLRI